MFVALAAVFVSGCGGQKNVASAAFWKSRTGVVTFALTPSPPKSLDTSTFQVSISDGKGHPVAGRQVAITLSMPSMQMPDNPVPTTETKPGTYTGTGKFTMPGLWQAKVTVSGGVDQPEIHSIPIHVQ